MDDKYKYIGPVYDLLSNIYSGRAIQDCKISMLTPSKIKPGDRVLFAGVGHGRDAIHAAELGADVTVVELSQSMLDEFGKLVAANPKPLKIRVVHSDIMLFDEKDSFDLVVSNFFLNVFLIDMMKKVLAHLITLAKPGAGVVVGDFQYPTGGIISRFFQKAYWYSALSVFRVFTKNPMHEIYNYPQHMSDMGLTIKEKQSYRLLGLDMYWSIYGQKPLAQASV